MSMSWKIRSPHELTDAERSAWDVAQRTNTSLDSPYFRPEWCDALAAVGRPIQVAVRGEGTDATFFAYEREGCQSFPTGRMINDYQGLVGSSQAIAQTPSEALLELCRESGLQSIHFDHVLAEQAPFANYHEVEASSPYIDLSGGRAAYEARLSKSGRSDASTARRKSRKMEREVGPLTLTYQSNDLTALDSLFAWKSAQYLQTGVPDVFAHNWARNLLSHLASVDAPSFRGVLTTLHTGDELVSTHFGLQSAGVLHWWFPTYNDAFSAYSPGRVMLQMLIDSGPDLGLTKIDLGKGMSSYKQRTMSAAVPLAEGVVEMPSMSRWVRQSASATKHWLKKTPLRKPLSVPARWLHHYLTRKAMQ